MIFNGNVCPRKCKYKLIHGLLKSVEVPKPDEFRQAFMSTIVAKLLVCAQKRSNSLLGK